MGKTVTCHRSPGMNESALERRLVAEVRKAGGMCLKFTSPSTRGVPDRIVLLPGGIMIFVLFCVAAIAAYGFYYRWRYGDPFKRAQEEMLKRMQQAAGGSAGGRQQTAAPSEEPEVRRGEAKTGIRRTTIIEDAVVVQEVRRRGPNDAKEQG